MKPWRPVDWIVVALVGILAYTTVVGSMVPFFDTTAMPESRSKLVANLLASVVSVISMYVGASLRGKDDDK